MSLTLFISCSRVFNLVNIHLFHDDDNLTAMETVSVYVLASGTAEAVMLSLVVVLHSATPDITHK